MVLSRLLRKEENFNFEILCQTIFVDNMEPKTKMHKEKLLVDLKNYGLML